MCSGIVLSLICRQDSLTSVDHIIPTINSNVIEEQTQNKVLILCLCNFAMYWLSNWCVCCQSNCQLQKVSRLASQQPLKQIAEHAGSRLHFCNMCLEKTCQRVSKDCLRVWLQVLLPATSNEVPVLIGIKIVPTYPQTLHGTVR